MKRTQQMVLGLAGWAGMSVLAYGQMLSNPTLVSGKDQNQVGGGFTMSKLDIEDEDGDADSIERRILFGELSFGFSPKVDLFGHIGMITDSKYTNYVEDGEDLNIEGGDGILFGGGIRGQVHKSRDGHFNAYGVFNMIEENITDKVTANDVKIKLDVSTTQISLGGVYTHQYSSTLQPYGGLEFHLDEDSEVKSKVENRDSVKEDIERDRAMNLRVGANIAAEGFNIRPELILLGERTMTLSATTRF